MPEDAHSDTARKRSETDGDTEYDEYTYHHRSKRRREGSLDRGDDSRSHRRKKHRRREDDTVDKNHRHRHRHRKSRRHQNGAESDTKVHPLDQDPRIDQETAFRESLFDAMADDEGAAYWENIYGQPIHIYPREKPNVDTGHLEQMTDDEYAAFVRQEMWKKTRAGWMEEQVREQERLKREKEEARRGEREQAESMRRNREEEAQRRRIERELEQALRRGQERKQKVAAQAAFAQYAADFQDWDGSLAAIPWPVESRQREDLNEKSIRLFFVRGLNLQALGQEEFCSRLKEHRVRWHPDKMQQRLGGKGQVEKSVMADVTMIFQVIDTLYNDTRKSK